MATNENGNNQMDQLIGNIAGEVSNFSTKRQSLDDNNLPGRKGRKIDPETLNKYMQIKAVLQERPNDFTRAELCKKHGVNYHNFSQWISKQQPRKEAPPRYKPVEKPVVGQSVIVTTMDDLINVISPMIRDVVKTAILEGIKLDKIKTLR